MNPQLNFRVSEELLADFQRWAGRFTDGDVGAWLGLCQRLVAESGGPKLGTPGRSGERPESGRGRGASARARKQKEK
jgi:hypothetical protein